MKSGLLHMPVATLGAAAPTALAATAVNRARGARAMAWRSAGTAAVMVVGAPGSGKSSVVNALVGTPGLAPSGGTAPPGTALPEAGRPVPAATATGPAVAAGTPGTGPAGHPSSSAFLVFRYGAQPAALAYVPGHRDPRPVALDELTDAEILAARSAPPRPPRRIEIHHPAELLRELTIVDTPSTGAMDAAYAEIVLDAVRPGDVVLFVTDASDALSSAQLDFLALAERRGLTVTFALTKIDSFPAWPAVLAANQTLVHEHVPRYACAPWYAVNAAAGGEGSVRGALDAVAGRPGVEEAARGLSGVDIADLRRALREHAQGPGAQRPRGEAGEDAGAVAAARRARPAVVVAADGQWQQLLDREINARRVSAGQRLAIDLATIHVRCVQELGAGHGPARLPHVFDRELHALSVQTSRALDAAATEVTRRLFGAILDAEPDQPALTRIRAATRAALDGLDSAGPAWDRILLLTTTAGVASVTGAGALASLAAVGPDPLGDALVAPVGIGLSAGCYQMWPRTAAGDKKVCRRWLQQAIHVIEGDLRRELDHRFAALREALAAVAGDTVDHGVLLA